jgi:hypothetical protein
VRTAAWRSRDRWDGARAQVARGLIGHLAEGLGQRLALELEAAGRHRDPERRDSLPAHIAHRQGQAAEVRRELLALERDGARADVGELSAKPVRGHDRGGREGPQTVADVALQATLVEQRHSATLPSASACAFSPMRGPRPGMSGMP